MPVNINGISVILADGVRETTSTAGLGAYSLNGAATVSGITYRTFVAGVGSGNPTCYTRRSGSQFETGIGTVTSGAPSTISRSLILGSSNAGAAVNWGAGVSDIIVDSPAALFHSVQAALDALVALQPAAPTLVNLSGSGIDVTGIRADARRVSAHVFNMTISGTQALSLALRTASGVHASGYGGRRMEINGNVAAEAAQIETAFFEPIGGGMTAAFNGEMTLALRNASTNLWSLSLVGLSGRWRQFWGQVILPGTLTGWRWEPVGADTFTSGTLSYMVE